MKATIDNTDLFDFDEAGEFLMSKIENVEVAVRQEVQHEFHMSLWHEERINQP